MLSACRADFNFAAPKSREMPDAPSLIAPIFAAMRHLPIAARGGPPSPLPFSLCLYSLHECNPAVTISVDIIICRDITGRLTMQTCLGSPEDPII